MTIKNGVPAPEHVIKQIRRLRFRDGFSIRRIAYIAGVSPMTVQKYLRLGPASAAPRGPDRPHEPDCTKPRS